MYFYFRAFYDLWPIFAGVSVGFYAYPGLEPLKRLSYQRGESVRVRALLQSIVANVGYIVLIPRHQLPLGTLDLSVAPRMLANAQDKRIVTS
jgi:hypothetical protein